MGHGLHVSLCIYTNEVLSKCYCARTKERSASVCVLSSSLMEPVHVVRSGQLWQEDETVELLSYFRQRVISKGLKKMVSGGGGKWQPFANHLNDMFHNKFPTKYVKKEGHHCAEKIRGCRRLYMQYRKRFSATMKKMTETGRETDELDDDRCQAEWSGWSLYHSVFHDDKTCSEGTVQSNNVNFCPYIWWSFCHHWTAYCTPLSIHQFTLVYSCLHSLPYIHVIAISN